MLINNPEILIKKDGTPFLCGLVATDMRLDKNLIANPKWEMQEIELKSLPIRYEQDNLNIIELNLCLT